MTWHPTTVPAEAAPEPPGGWFPTRVEGRALLLIPDAGAWFAIEDRCSHAGCAFSEDGELDGTTVICGCHGSEFDTRSGAVIRSPADRPIATFPTRTAEGLVEVDVP
jgi:nitrite reductase/ring-hydroxylating ferredoxin subunit